MDTLDFDTLDFGTPAFHVDRDILDRDIAWLQERCRARGAELRPQVKTQRTGHARGLRVAARNWVASAPIAA